MTGKRNDILKVDYYGEFSFCVEIFLMKGNILVCNVTFLFCFFSCLMIVHTDYFILFDIWINLKCLINGKLIGGGQRIMTRSWSCTMFRGSISKQFLFQPHLDLKMR